VRNSYRNERIFVPTPWPNARTFTRFVATGKADAANEWRRCRTHFAKLSGIFRKLLGRVCRKYLFRSHKRRATDVSGKRALFNNRRDTLETKRHRCPDALSRVIKLRAYTYTGHRQTRESSAPANVRLVRKFSTSV